jgi:FkbM family methyltransferase
MKLRLADLPVLSHSARSTLRALGGRELVSRLLRWSCGELFGPSAYNRPIVAALLRSHTQHPDATFIDVGFHRGEVARGVIPFFRRAVIIEPNPAFFDELAALAHELSGTDIYIVHSAVGPSESEEFLYTSGINSGDNSLAPRADLRRGPRVRVRTLDQIVANSGYPGPYLIKIDVQGTEPGVLEGAAAVLSATEVLVIEFCPWMLHESGYDPRALISTIEAKSFVIRDLMGRVTPRDKLERIVRMGLQDELVTTDLLLTNHSPLEPK